MKRLFIFILLLSSLVIPAISSAGAQDETGVLEICNANVTAAAYCTTNALPIGFVSSKHTCHITTSGTAPTTITVSIYGSVDGITYGALATQVYTVASADTATFHIANKGAKYLKGYYVSKTGGDATSAVTIKCSSGGN